MAAPLSLVALHVSFAGCGGIGMGRQKSYVQLDGKAAANKLLAARLWSNLRGLWPTRSGNCVTWRDSF